MAMPQGQAPVLTPFSVMSLWLNADPVDGAKKKPSLRVGFFGNVPRITVKTNVDGDMNHGKIDFNCDTATFAAAMSYLRDLAEGKDVPQERKFVYMNDYVAGKKLDRFMAISSLVIAREQTTGRIYIAVLSSQQSRPRIRFFFGPSKFHTITNGDGSPITPKEMSEAYAIGFLKPAEQVIYHMMVSNFDENAKNVANPNNMNGGAGPGGNGGGGYQNRQNNGGGGGYQQKPTYGGGGGNGGGASSGFDSEMPEF